VRQVELLTTNHFMRLFIGVKLFRRPYGHYTPALPLLFRRARRRFGSNVCFAYLPAHPRPQIRDMGLMMPAVPGIPRQHGIQIQQTRLRMPHSAAEVGVRHLSHHVDPAIVKALQKL
jgi:hypothetical protein